MPKQTPMALTGIIPLNRSKLLQSDCVLTTPKAEIIAPDAPKKKRSELFRISNSILTDRVEDLEEVEENRATAAATPNKKRNAIDEVAAPSAKRPKKATSQAPKVIQEEEEEETWKVSEPKQCCLCSRPPMVPTKAWTQCPSCTDTWICRHHPMGLEDHFTEEHPDHEVPGRKRRSKLSRYRDEWMMTKHVIYVSYHLLLEPKLH